MIAVQMLPSIRRPESYFIDFDQLQTKRLVFDVNEKPKVNLPTGKVSPKPKFKEFAQVDEALQKLLETEVQSEREAATAVMRGKSWVQHDTVASVLAAQRPAIDHRVESAAGMSDEISRRILAVLNSMAALAANQKVGEVRLLETTAFGNSYGGDRTFWVRVGHDLDLNPFASDIAVNLLARDLYAWLVRDRSVQFPWGRLELGGRVGSVLWQVLLVPAQASVPNAFNESMEW